MRKAHFFCFNAPLQPGRIRTFSINAANEEQSMTSEQISRNVETISTVSHESAFGISQIAQAADGLSRLTDDLRQLVDQFQIDRDRKTASLSPDRAPASPHLSVVAKRYSVA
jgi:methyl-accepting chemotaxis protein